MSNFLSVQKLDLTCFWNITCSSTFNNYPFCKTPHIFRDQINPLIWILNNLKQLDSKNCQDVLHYKYYMYFYSYFKTYSFKMSAIFYFYLNSQVRYFYLGNTLRTQILLSLVILACSNMKQYCHTYCATEFHNIGALDNFTAWDDFHGIPGHLFHWAVECMWWLLSFPHSLTGLIHASFLCLD